MQKIHILGVEGWEGSRANLDRSRGDVFEFLSHCRSSDFTVEKVLGPSVCLPTRKMLSLK
jgi:hypothetical protein